MQVAKAVAGARAFGDAAQAGIDLVLAHFESVLLQPPGWQRAEVRLRALLTLGRRGVPQTEEYFATQFGGSSGGRALVAAWPFIQALSRLYGLYENGSLTRTQAIEPTVEGAAAALVAGGGETGRQILDLVTESVVRANARRSRGDRTPEEERHNLTLSMLDRSLRPTDYEPRGTVADLAAFLRVVAQRRLSDARPGSRSIRRYRSRGIDITDPEAVERAQDAGTRAMKHEVENLSSGRETATKLGVPDSTLRLSVDRARKAGKKVGTEVKVGRRTYIYFTASDRSLIRKYVPLRYRRRE